MEIGGGSYESTIPASEGVVGKVLDWLNTPSYLSAATALSLQTGKPLTEALREAATGETRPSYIDVARNAGLPTIPAFALGLAGDLILDPLNLIPGHILIKPFKMAYQGARASARVAEKLGRRLLPREIVRYTPQDIIEGARRAFVTREAVPEIEYMRQRGRDISERLARKTEKPLTDVITQTERQAQKIYTESRKVGLSRAVAKELADLERIKVASDIEDAGITFSLSGVPRDPSMQISQASRDLQTVIDLTREQVSKSMQAVDETLRVKFATQLKEHTDNLTQQLAEINVSLDELRKKADGLRSLGRVPGKRILRAMSTLETRKAKLEIQLADPLMLWRSFAKKEGIRPDLYGQYKTLDNILIQDAERRIFADLLSQHQDAVKEAVRLRMASQEGLRTAEQLDRLRQALNSAPSITKLSRKNVAPEQAFDVLHRLFITREDRELASSFKNWFYKMWGDIPHVSGSSVQPKNYWDINSILTQLESTLDSVRTAEHLGADELSALMKKVGGHVADLHNFAKRDVEAAAFIQPELRRMRRKAIDALLHRANFRIPGNLHTETNLTKLANDLQSIANFSPDGRTLAYNILQRQNLVQYALPYAEELARRADAAVAKRAELFRKISSPQEIRDMALEAVQEELEKEIGYVPHMLTKVGRLALERSLLRGKALGPGTTVDRRAILDYSTFNARQLQRSLRVPSAKNPNSPTLVEIDNAWRNGELYVNAAALSRRGKQTGKAVLVLVEPPKNPYASFYERDPVRIARQLVEQQRRVVGNLEFERLALSSAKTPKEIESMPASMKMLYKQDVDSGLFLPNDVYDALTRSRALLRTPNEYSAFLDMYDRTTNFFRRWNYLPWPISMLRNYISEMVFDYMAGMPIPEIGLRRIEAARLLRKWRKKPKALTQTERDLISEMLDQRIINAETLSREILPSGQRVSLPLRAAGAVHRWIEDTARAAHYLWAREKFSRQAIPQQMFEALQNLHAMERPAGISDPVWNAVLHKRWAKHQARMSTLETHYDYSDLTPFETKYMKRMFYFYTFMRKNTPTMIKRIAERPVRFGNIGKVTRDINIATESEEAFEDLPPWVRASIPLRVPDITGLDRMLFANMNTYVPIDELSNVLASPGEGGLLNRVLTAMAPIPGLAATYGLGYEPFIGPEKGLLGGRTYQFAGQELPRVLRPLTGALRPVSEAGKIVEDLQVLGLRAGPLASMQRLLLTGRTTEAP